MTGTGPRSIKPGPSVRSVVVAVLTGLLGLLVLGLAAALRAPATTANGATLRHVARIGATVGVLGAAVGSAWGLNAGLEYPPTALVALVEGGILFGVPSVLVGVLLGLASAPFYRHRHKAAFE